jgi:hypothetical protein
MLIALIVFLLMGGIVLEAAKPIAHRTIGPEKPTIRGGVTKRRGKKTRGTKKSHR